MSLVLSKNTISGVETDVALTPFCKSIRIGNVWLSPENFRDLVMYVLTNADLRENDERIALIADISRLELIKGYNRGYMRLGVVDVRDDVI